jgi:transcriptional regulator CtsR
MILICNPVKARSNYKRGYLLESKTEGGGNARSSSFTDSQPDSDELLCLSFILSATLQYWIIRNNNPKNKVH